MAETGTITAYRWFVEPCGTQREQKTPKEGAVWVDWVDHVIISLGIFASWKFQDKLTYLRFGMTGSAHCSSYTILYSYVLKLFQGSFQWAGFGNAAHWVLVIESEGSHNACLARHVITFLPPFANQGAPRLIMTHPTVWWSLSEVIQHLGLLWVLPVCHTWHFIVNHPQNHPIVSNQRHPPRSQTFDNHLKPAVRM